MRLRLFRLRINTFKQCPANYLPVLQESVKASANKTMELSDRGACDVELLCVGYVPRLSLLKTALPVAPFPLTCNIPISSLSVLYSMPCSASCNCISD